MNLRGWVASLTFLGGVPLGIWLAYEGHWRGLYSYGAIPLAFAVVVGVLFVVVLFGVLPRLDDAGG